MTSLNRRRRGFVISVVATGAGCASSSALAQSMVNEADPQAKALGYVSDATKAAPGPRRANLVPARPSTDRLASLDFKGNKQSLPVKPCAACGRSMTWRKRWSKTWSEVKFCSEACRKIVRTSVRV